MDRLVATQRLNETQRAQVFQQWDMMNTLTQYVVDIPLTPHGDVLTGLAVHPGVWQPDKVSARYHASFLFLNNARLYLGRKVLDMGTGTGIQGIVMALGGATEVTCCDISTVAVNNVQDNIHRFNLRSTVNAVRGDLFENVSGKYHLITFMHPYFDGDPPAGDTIAGSMLNDGTLIRRFFQQVERYLEPDGLIIMPSLDLAGDVNNPAFHGPAFGFTVETAFDLWSSGTIQIGRLRMHELRPFQRPFG